MELGTLKKWSLFIHMSDEELEDIDFCVVYGSERHANEGQSALFITKGNYEVFGIGFSNMVEFSTTVIPFNGVSPSDEDSLFHTKVDALCGLGIKKIVVGGHFGAALSTTNELYVWGDLDMTVRNPGLVVTFEKHVPGSKCTKCGKEYKPALLSDSSLVMSGHFAWCAECDWYPSYSFGSCPPPDTPVYQFIRGDKVMFPCLKCGRKCTPISLSIYVLNFCDHCKLLRELGPWDAPTPEMLAPRRVRLPPEIKIADIECSRSFLVMKCVSGRLLAWGAIDKNYYKGYVENPDNIVVKGVSCGASHVAVTSNCGRLYTFGYGAQGQLGYAWQEEMGHITLRRVQMSRLVRKCCCRRNGTVCLMDDGTVTVFGNYIRIIRTRSHRKSPTVTLNQASFRDCAQRPVTIKGKFSDVACAKLSNVFVAQSTPIVFCWGHLVRNRTQLSRMSSLGCAEALADLPVTLSNFSRSGQHLPLSSPTACMYGNPLISDMTLKLSDGLFPVHKFVLYTSSVYFKRFFEETDSTPDILDVTFFNPKAYKTLLKYFYQVPIVNSDLSCGDFFDLHGLAVAYCESHVTADVVHRLKGKITPLNASQYLPRAEKDGLDVIIQECKILMQHPIFPEQDDLEELD